MTPKQPDERCGAQRFGDRFDPFHDPYLADPYRFDTRYLLEAKALLAELVYEFLGRRLDSAARAVVGPLVSVCLLVYAAGIWRLRGWALPMAWFYAAYVTANLLLFPFRTP